MYRKEQRRLQNMADQQQVITRVANYPVVKDAWAKMSEVYQRGKDGSRVLKFCGGMMESGANLAYQASQPVLEKLPVGVVNDYALAKLESLEESYPVIAEPTDKVVDAAKTYSCEKLSEAANYSSNKIDKLAHVTGVDAALSMAEFTIDQFLPELPEADDDVPAAQVKAPEATEGVVGKAVTLTDKLRRRAYSHAMARIGSLKQRSEEAVAKLVHTVDLIDVAKNLSEVSYADVKEKVVTMYEEVTSEGELTPLPADASLERKAILSARIMTQRVRNAFETISQLSSVLPASARSSIDRVLKSAELMYQTLSKFDVSRHSSVLISQLRANLEQLRTHVLSLGNHYYSAAATLIDSTLKTGGVSIRLVDAPTPYAESSDEENDDGGNEAGKGCGSDAGDGCGSDAEFADDADSLLNSTKDSGN